MPTRPAPIRPVAMIVHAYYEEDARVRRQAEWLASHGRPVDVFALRRPSDPPSVELHGVRVHHLPVRRHQGAGVAVYLAEYAAFLVRAGLAATVAHRRRRYALVQVHTIPDYLVFAALPLRLAGVPVLLDMHEAMPEFFRSRFPRAAGRLPLALLRLQERLSVRFATAVMTVNDALADRLRGIEPALERSPERLTVVLNTPRLDLFDPARSVQRPFRADGSLRVVYAGALTPTYEVDVLVDAIGLLAARRPDLRPHLDIYGRGDSEPALLARAASAGRTGLVTFHGRIPLEKVPGAIAAADVGAAPTRRDPFTDISLSTKVFEYAAMGKPVVASRLPTVERYFAPDSVATYDPGDPASLAATLERLADDPAERDGRVERTAARIAQLSWDRQAEEYGALVERLAAPRA